MNNEWTSIYLDVLYFLWTMFYRFQSLRFALLFNFILFHSFSCYHKLFFHCYFKVVHCKCIQIKLIFCTLILYPTMLLNFLVLIFFFFFRFLRVLHIQDHVNCKHSFYFLLSNLDTFYIFAWVPWLYPSVQCWPEVVKCRHPGL